MTPPRLALAIILLSFALTAMALLTSCQSLGDAQVCVRTDYGTFCYNLPKPTSSK